MADPEVRAIEGAWVIHLACGGRSNFCQHLQILQDNLGREEQDDGQGPPACTVVADRQPPPGHQEGDRLLRAARLTALSAQRLLQRIQTQENIGRQWTAGSGGRRRGQLFQ